MRKHARSTRLSSGLASPRSRSRTARFVAVFALVLLVGNLSYYQWIVGSRFFEAYLGWSAALAAKWLRLSGIETGYADATITGPFRMSIRAGCDGLQAFGVLLAATLAFPARATSRLAGVVLGALLVFILNTVRLASLYWLGARQSSWFEPAHVHLWPAALIVAVVGLWMAWAARVGPPRGATRA